MREVPLYMPAPRGGCRGCSRAGTRTALQGTSLIRNRVPLKPCSRPMPRVLGGSQEGGLFLCEVPV